MFENLITQLEAELGPLREKKHKCESLMGQVTDKEKKAALEARFTELCQAIDRVTLCMGILKYEVSLEASPDFFTVKFPVAQKAPVGAGQPSGRLL